MQESAVDKRTAELMKHYRGDILNQLKKDEREYELFGQKIYAEEPPPFENLPITPKDSIFRKAGPGRGRKSATRLHRKSRKNHRKTIRRRHRRH